MARTNQKTVVKNYDVDTVNGWSLNYEYESENGASPAEIRITGNKGQSSVYISKTSTNMSVNFSGAIGFDMDVIMSVNSEINAITDSFMVETETAE
jgi:hypothetical protein